MKKSFKLFAAICCIFSSASYATINTVQINTNKTSTVDYSRVLTVSNHKVSGHNVPFIAGERNQVHFIGNFVDVCDRVEIVSSPGGTIIATYKTSAELLKQNISGVGNLTFTIRTTDLPAANTDFIIRIRYAIETNGYDQLDCRVTSRGVINSVQWGGPNLPLIEPASNGREKSVLRRNTSYTLILNGTNFGNGATFSDGIKKRLFSISSSTGAAFSQDNITVNATGTQISFTFTPTSTVSQATSMTLLGDETKTIPFTRNIIASIAGGWGSYVYHKYISALPTTGALTDLSSFIILTESAYDQELTLQGPELGFVQPPVINQFVSNSFPGSGFDVKDLDRFSLCNPAGGGNIKLTIIPDMEIPIKNTGNSTAVNVIVSITFPDGTVKTLPAIPSIAPNETINAKYHRPDNTVCGAGSQNTTATGQTNQGTCFRCSNAQNNNLPTWTDAGILIKINPVPNEQNINNNTLQL